MEKNTALTALETANAAYLAAEAARDRAALTAKNAGASFADIARLLGITKQRAHQRYSQPAAARNTSRDHLFTAGENAAADEALAALQAVAAMQDHHAAAVEFLDGQPPQSPSTKLASAAPAPAETTTIKGITAGPPHVKEWPKEYRRSQSKKVDDTAPAKPPMAKGASKKGTTPALDSMTGDPRPSFTLHSAGRKDGVAQPGTGKGPHTCPRCGSTNHKSAEPHKIHAYPGECKATKYDPQDIADVLTNYLKASK